MTTIERKYGIARSTLSGWFKEVELSEEQRTRLMKNSQDGWKKARENALVWHKAQKNIRLDKAKREADCVYQSIPQTNEVLELALAMLYFGEGSKNHTTAMGAADPALLKFFLSALERVYGLDRKDFRYDLHLRDDQNEAEYKTFWANELKIPEEKIGYIVKDKRTIGKPTRNDYKGVCLITVGKVAILRRLKALYTVYCSDITVGT
ncbi:hypothetical protein KC959_02850 [Candidatus Saccharibacteria bacterium]|nr:hypothetical protein [Candidatus Saccharibacteria bacterium]